MKLKKLRIQELADQTIAVYEEPDNGVMGIPLLILVKPPTEEGEALLQLLIAAPTLVNTATKLLSHGLEREGYEEFNADVRALQRAITFATRELRLDTVLWREENFDFALRELSKDKDTEISAAPTSVAGKFKNILRRLFD